MQRRYMGRKKSMPWLSVCLNLRKWDITLDSLSKKLPIYLTKNHCLYVNSGSSALFVGVESFGFPAGGEVITPALTFSTSIGCLVKNNLIPVFVDVEPLTYCIDVSQIEAQITEKTVAILAPNLMGNLCDWPKIREIADRYNLIVIEDSAEYPGCKNRRSRLGFLF